MRTSWIKRVLIEAGLCTDNIMVLMIVSSCIDNLLIGNVVHGIDSVVELCILLYKTFGA